MKNRLINLSIFLIGIIFATFLGELIIRTLIPQKLLRPCIVPDPDLAFRGAENCKYLDDWTPHFYEYFVSLNNEGLRMERDIAPKDSNQILCLGDSFTYGMGVNYDDTFYAHLEDWPDKFGSAEKLVNGAFQAYGTGHSTKKLEKLSSEYPFEKVIYFMYFNDLFDNVNLDKNYRTHIFKEKENGAIDLKPVKVYSPFKRFWHRLGIADWLYKNSHLVIFLKNSLARKKASFDNVEPQFKGKLSKTEINLMQKVSLAHLKNLVEKCTERNLELMIIWIPCWLELNLENDFDWHTNFPFSDFKNELKNQISTQNQTQFFDPTFEMDVLLKHQNLPMSAYYFEEGHYTKKGNLLFFNAVKDDVLEFVSN